MRHLAGGFIPGASARPLFLRVGLMLLLSAASDRIGAVPPAAPGVPAGLRVLSNLSYRKGSKDCRLDLALPAERSDRPRPAIVVIHGGGWIEGDKSSFAVTRTPGNILEFAAAGFVAATINYRLSREAPYPAGFDDCQAAVRWLKSHAAEYRIDPHRIGAYGNSAGGHLSLLLGLAEPDRVQAVVSDSGPIDLVQEYKNGTIRGVIERFMGGPPEGARLAEYKRASPISYLGRKTPPLLLIYGEADNQIDVRTADRFVEELGRRGNRGISYFRLAGVGHCPHSLVRVGYLRPAVIEFFQRALAN